MKRLREEQRVGMSEVSEDDGFGGKRVHREGPDGHSTDGRRPRSTRDWGNGRALRRVVRKWKRGRNRPRPVRPH